jgi:hypothetical protein
MARYAGAFFPTVVRMGWQIPAMTKDDLAQVLPVVSDGLGHISTMFEDGFRNYNFVEFPAPFDIALDSAAVLRWYYVPDGDAMGYSRWYPVSMVGLEVLDTAAAVIRAQEIQAKSPQLARQIYERIVQEGVGSCIPNTVNNFVWSSLIPEGKLDEATFYLDSASRMFSGEQGINARSNLGIVHFLAGDDDVAEEIFNSILDDVSDFSDAEALYFLSLIASERGEPDVALQRQNECQALGGYDCELDVDRFRPALMPVSGGTVSQTTAQKSFCTQCGNPRSDRDKFCSSCGTAFR